MTDDFSELRQLSADLRGAGVDVSEFARKAIQVTAHNIKEDWRRAADRTGLGRYAADITYQSKVTDTEISAEIGPTIGDSGSFGFVEDAPGDVQSAPQHAGRDAMEKHEPDFIDGLEIALYDSLRRAVGGS